MSLEQFQFRSSSLEQFATVLSFQFRSFIIFLSPSFEGDFHCTEGDKLFICRGNFASSFLSLSRKLILFARGKTGNHKISQSLKTYCFKHICCYEKVVWSRCNFSTTTPYCIHKCFLSVILSVLLASRQRFFMF